MDAEARYADRLDRAKAALARGALTQALGELHKCLFLQPEEATLFSMCVDVYCRIGDLNSAAQYARKLLALRPDDEAAKQWLATICDALGFSLLQDRQFEEAGHRFTEAIHMNEMKASYWAHRAVAQAGLQRWQDGVRDLDRAVSLDSSRPDYFVLRAKLRWQLAASGAGAGHQSMGNADIRRAHALDPQHPEVRAFEEALWSKAEQAYMQASAAMLRGELADAARLLEGALSFSPTDIKSLVLKAAVRRRQGLFDLALRDLDAASVLYRRMKHGAPAADGGGGGGGGGGEAGDGGVRVLGERAAQQLSPRAGVTRELDGGSEHPEIRKQRSLTLNDMALSCMRARRFADGVRLLNMVIELEAEAAAASDGTEEVDHRFFVNRGDCHRALGHLQQALSDYHRAIDAAPRSWEVRTRLAMLHDMFGVQLFNQHEYAHADVEFSTAISYNSKISAIFVHRGDTRHLQQRFEAAHSDFREALRLDPGNTEASQKLQQFEFGHDGPGARAARRVISLDADDAAADGHPAHRRRGHAAGGGGGHAAAKPGPRGSSATEDAVRALLLQRPPLQTPVRLVPLAQERRKPFRSAGLPKGRGTAARPAPAASPVQVSKRA